MSICRRLIIMQPLADHAASGSQAIVTAGEKDHQGLCSILTSCCVDCLQKFQFAASSRVQSIVGGRYWECNQPVWGQLATEGGQFP